MDEVNPRIKRFRLIAGPNGSGKSTLVSTADNEINRFRVANRYAQGGHSVPDDKIISRYSRSIAQLKPALPYLNRAFVFDNSGTAMDYLGQYESSSGWAFSRPSERLPQWFVEAI